MIGQTLGQYRIIEQIGRGGMATVYKAYHPTMDRNVAIKVMPQHFASDPDFTARFDREAKVVAKLQHPHILPVFDYGQEGDISYIVMPYVPSGDLKKYIQSKAGKQPLGEVARIFSQISGALDYAHQRGILHRDIKPDNILFDESGNPLLSDFGLTKMAESTSNLTGSALIGTPSYMSPEQGQGQRIDHRSDIYSMGIVLYEMVTGQVPYRADTPIAVIFMHVSDPLPMPKSFRPDLPDAAQNVILKALSKNPEDRYQTCSAFARAFSQAIAQVDTAQPQSVTDDNEPQTVVGIRNAVDQPVADVPTHILDAPADDKPKRTESNRSIGLLGVIAAIVILAIIGGGALLASGVLTPATPTTGPTETIVAQAADVTVSPAGRLLSSDNLTETAQANRVTQTPSATPTEHATATPTAPAIQVLRAGVPVREAPSFDSSTIMRLNSGDTLEITGISEDGSWYLIDLVDTQAWVAISDSITTAGDLLAIQIAVPTATPTLTTVPTDTLTPSPTATSTPLPTDTPTLQPTKTPTHTPQPTSVTQRSETADGQVIESRLIKVQRDNQSAIVWKLAMNPAGTLVLAAGWDGSAFLYEFATGETVGSIRHPVGIIRAATFEPDGNVFITGGDDGVVRFWNTETLELEHKIDIGESIEAIASHPNGLTAVAIGPGEILFYFHRAFEFELTATRGQASTIRSITFSPDGQLLASASAGSELILWNLETHEIQATFREAIGEYKGIRFSPDGREIVVPANTDTRVIVWDIDTNETRTLEGHKAGALDAAFSADGRLLVTSANDNTVRVWDFATGNLLLTLSGGNEAAFSVAITPDGRFIASGDGNGVVRFWETTAMEVVTVIDEDSTPQTDPYENLAQFLIEPEGLDVLDPCGPQGKNLCIRNGREVRPIAEDLVTDYWSATWSPDGKFIVATTNVFQQPNGFFLLLNRDGELIRRVPVADMNMGFPAWSPDGRWIAFHGSCRLTLVQPETVEITQPPVRGCVIDGQWSPDSQQLVISSVPESQAESIAPDRTIRLVDIHTFDVQDIVATDSHRMGCMEVGISPDAQFIAYMDTTCQPFAVPVDGSVPPQEIEQFPYWWRGNVYPQWDIAPAPVYEGVHGIHARLIATRTDLHYDDIPDDEPFFNKINDFSIDLDSGQFIAVSENGSIGVYTLTDGRLIRAIHSNRTALHAVAVVPPDSALTESRGNVFMTGGDAGILSMWSQEELERIANHNLQANINAITFSPDNSLIAIAADIQTGIYDESLTPRLNFLADAPVQSLAFSPDGTRIASGMINGDIDIWHLASESRVITLSDHVASIEAVAFSPDNDVIAGVGDFEPEVYIWDAYTGQLLRQLIGHEAGTLDLQFSSSGQYLVTGSDDNTARVWNFSSGNTLLTIPDHEKSVYAVALSADNRYLLTGDGDGVIRIFALHGLENEANLPAPENNSEATMHVPSGIGLEIPSGVHQIGRCPQANKPCIKDDEGNVIQEIDGNFGMLSIDNFTWSPGGEAIYYTLSGRFRIYRTSIDDPAPDEAFSVDKGPITSIAWSPDGEQLAIVQDCKLIITDASGQIFDKKSDALCYEDAQWLASGNAVITMSASARNRHIRLVEIGSDTITLFHEYPKTSVTACEVSHIAANATGTYVAFYQDRCEPYIKSLDDVTTPPIPIETFPAWWRGDYYPQWGQ